jgi:hypothetical protein
MPSPAGISFGKYVLIERLAAGGMAEVFKAKKLGVAGFEKVCAVKRILPSFSEDKDFQNMFIDEATLASQLTHANIVNVDDFGSEQGQFFLVMEYIAGVDLSKFLKLLYERNARLPIEVGSFVMAEICSGLSYAHSRTDDSGQPLGLVHRDVSPQNILLSFAGDVKLADFGIAKARRKIHVTAVGAVVGKFRYMSPEQVVGTDLDGRSDVFSAGAVLWELLVGRPLFDGEGTTALEQIKTMTVPPPSQFNSQVSPALDHIVTRALARSREERYATAAEMGRSLRQFLHAMAPGYASDDLSTFIGRVVPRPTQPVKQLDPAAAAAAEAQMLGNDATVAATVGARGSGASGGGGAAPSADVLEAALERELGAPPAGPAPESTGWTGPREMGDMRGVAGDQPTGPSTLGSGPGISSSVPPRSFGGVTLDHGDEGPRYPPRKRSGTGTVVAWLGVCLVLGGGGYFGWTRYKDKLMALVGPLTTGDTAGDGGGTGTGSGTGSTGAGTGPVVKRPDTPPKGNGGTGPVAEPKTTPQVRRPRVVWDDIQFSERRTQLLASRNLARLLGAPGTSPPPAALNDPGLRAMLEALSTAIGQQRLDQAGVAVAEPIAGPLATRLRGRRLLKEAEQAIELFRQGGGRVPEEMSAVARLIAQSKGILVAQAPGRPGYDLSALLAYLAPADAAAQEAVVRARTLAGSFGDASRLAPGEQWLNAHLISRPEAIGRLAQLGPNLPLTQAIQRYEAAIPRNTAVALPGDLKLTLLEARGPRPGQKGTLTLKLKVHNAGTLPVAPPWAAFRLQGSGEARGPSKAPAGGPLAPGNSSEVNLSFAALPDDLTLVVTVPAGNESRTLRVASAPHGDLASAGGGSDDDDYFR